MAFPLSRMGFSLLQLFYIRSGICLMVVVLLILLHIGMLSAVTTTTCTFVGNETDCLALLAFKSEIKHDPHGIVNSWNNSFHFCDWQGVTCSHQHRRRVTIINLESTDLVGSLSPYIGNLSFLRGLRLYNNTFQGEIPTELGNLFRMKALNLTNNNFEGEIPANLSCCSNLTFLGVSSNNLAGKLPKELNSLSNLIYPGIHENNLTGGIPSFIGNPTSLKTNSIAYNPLGGTIRNTLGQLKKLTIFAMGGCQPSGMLFHLQSFLPNCFFCV